MDINELFNENERPLERLTESGGFCSIFRTIGCVGDSLSSGEFETCDAEGNHGYHDLYEYSWGQFMARVMGSKVYNFSRGGMTAKEYLDTYADENDFWNPAKACQAYILALGVNDLYGVRQEIGSLKDIAEDWHNNNTETFAGCYASIIQRLKEIQPEAKFFLMTMPRGDKEPYVIEAGDAHQALLHQLAAHFNNTYVLDLREYAPVYDDEFRKKFFLLGHMNPAGYQLTARFVMSYIDYIIRHNMEDFFQVGFIGTDIRH